MTLLPANSFLSALTGLLLPLSLFASPNIVVDNSIHDFGSVHIKGEAPSVNHAFTLSNTGDEELIIGSVKTSCGCTTAKLDTKRLLPGATVALNTSLSLKGRRGVMSKNITVTSNDPDTPKLLLTLKVNADREVDVSPAYVNFRVDSRAKQTPARLVSIRFNSQTPFKISPIDSEVLSFCAVELEELRAGFEYRLRFKLNPHETLTENRKTEMFTVNTDHPDVPVLQIPVSYYKYSQPKQKEISVYPQYITLPKVLADGRPFKHTMLIRSNQNRPLNVLEITPPSDDVIIKAQQTRKAYVRYEVTFTSIASALDGQLIEIRAEHEGGTPQTFKIPIRLR